MKILSFFEKMFNPYILIALNAVIIFAAEFAGDGEFFRETGLVHAVAILFVGLIVVRIFSEYAFSDNILRGFLKIQLPFFLVLGLAHVYEYFGSNVFMFNSEVVELSVMVSYLLWVLGVLLALEFVLRIYYKKSSNFIVLFSAVVILGFLMLLVINLYAPFSEALPLWFPMVVLGSIVGFGLWAIVLILKISKIMPVFKEYSLYAIPAIVLVAASAFNEYFESAHTLSAIGVSDTQSLYISHFLIYAALSILLVGFGRLKKPKGIYTDI